MVLLLKRNYDYYKSVLRNSQKPLAYIDLNYLDENIRTLLNKTGHKKKIRIATKSIRCANLLQYILNKSAKFCGLMSYDGNETLYLIRQGFDNILLGYPIVDETTLDNIFLEIKNGKNICFMVDDKKHIQALEIFGKKHDIQVSICLDINLSQEYSFLYFGAHRSSVKTKESLHDICNFIKNCSHINFKGMMGYEAQIASLGDNKKGEFFKNLIVRFLKQMSVKKISKLRQKYYQIIQDYKFNLDFVNGGGSGSMETTVLDSTVTEITVGSAFYAPHFLDDFCGVHYLPAAGFAVEITRQPSQNIFTAHGGGYNSSGPQNQNKIPKPYLPEGLFLFPNESAGEVQTPLLNKGKTLLQIGDPVFMRHAKGGEMCERFNKLHLILDGEVIKIVNTYRGDGLCTL